MQLRDWASNYLYISDRARLLLEEDLTEENIAIQKRLSNAWEEQGELAEILYGSVLATAGWELIEALAESPEFLEAFQKLANAGNKQALKIVDLVNELRAKGAENLVRVLSKYKIPYFSRYSVLKGILNSGREYRSAAELFEQGIKIYEFFDNLYKALIK